MRNAMKTITILVALSFALAAALAPTAAAQDALPRPEQPFQGHVDRKVKDSVKDYPREVAAPKGAPNVLLIMTDDVGFGASSTFGGPIPTETMDPGYSSLMPKSCGTFAEVLKQNGYNTAWYGKNHNVPDWHGSQAGPYDLWPTGLGFEYFYGFIGGDAN
jgi:hypothetical protein